MATYKQYKAKYMWLTNAHNTFFSNIAVLLSITSKLILKLIKTWVQSKVINHKNFLQANTSMFWLINSIIDAIFNLSTSIHDMFVVDISR